MKRYEKYSRIGKVKLTKVDLCELITLLKDNFSPQPSLTDYFSISTNLPNLHINESDSDKFLQHNELPDSLNNISITLSIHAKSIYEISKHISLFLDDSNSHLSIHSNDQTWVLGKNSQIITYVKNKNSILWFFDREIISLIIGVIGSALLVIILLFLESFFKNGITSINPLLLLSILPLILLLYVLIKTENTSIVIHKKKSFIIEHGPIITIILSFLSLLASVIIGILQFYKN